MPQDKRSLTLRGWFRLIAICLVLAILVVVSRLMLLEWRQFDRAEQAQQAVSRLRLALLASEMVSRERGPANAMLGADEARGTAAQRESLHIARLRTDVAYSQLNAVLRDTAVTGSSYRARQQVAAFRLALTQARTRVDALAAKPRALREPGEIRAAVQGMVQLVPMLTPSVMLFADMAQQADPMLAPSVLGARLAAELREYAGLLGSLFTPALTRQSPFLPDELTGIQQVKGRIAQLHDLLHVRMSLGEHSPGVLQAHARMDQDYFGQAGALLREVLDAGHSHGLYPVDAGQFAARYVPPMDAIVALRDVQLTEADARSAAAQAQSLRTMVMVGAMTAVGLVLLLWMLHMAYRRFVNPLSQAAQALHALGRGDLSHPLPAGPSSEELGQIVVGIQTLRVATQSRDALEKERDQLIDSLRAQSSTDFLTGLPNRRSFFEVAEAELARARRHEFNVVVMLIDVDHFKRVNDSVGHAGGDHALVAIGQTLRNSMRQGDVVARLGGEEFVALLSYCEPEDAERFADRLREAVGSQWVEVGDNIPPVQLTVSIGLADARTHGLDLNRLLARADDALYAAKAAGRNATRVARVRA
ncbi:diguanylate cyclase [Aquabacterium sp. A3]|uniref:GGDEF domain-containing protein n=1 Tax=Aquabacterium sp. A3 TaxID=3132829 RepID=UPI00311A5E74